MDEAGQPVDWWFAYKVPKLVADQLTHAASGYEYVYFDARSRKLQLSPFSMASGKGALDMTLQSVFQNPAPTTGWILYNDEMPVEAHRSDQGKFGHTKGVIAFDTKTKTAFWLLHSWPKFAMPGSDHMPVPDYGQTFMCITLDLETAGIIAHQMDNHQEPQLFAPRIPSTLSRDHPLNKITLDVEPNAIGDSNIISCTSRAGMPFKVIAKNRKWGKDFWIDLVGPTLQADMDIETWIRGRVPPVIDSDGHHHVDDIKFIDFRPIGYDYVWSETHDHAKWGLTLDKDWICVGDINRMVSPGKNAAAERLHFSIPPSGVI